MFNVTVTFSEAVTLAGGNLVVTLETGTNDRTVTISTISGSNTASGTYEVQAGDTSSDLTASGIALSAGSLSDAAGNAMSSFAIGSNLASSSALVIDTTPATVTNVTSTTDNGSYKATDVISIQVTFSEVMTVSGTPQLTLETGANDAVVDYDSGTGSNTLTFTYTVGAGQTSSDLDYASTGALALNSGSILDPAGNASTLTLADPGAAGSLGANKALVIDTTAPTIEVVTEVTTPSNDTTPSYVFTTNEAGTITTNITQGFSTNASAGTGENTVTFNTLPAGTYADKTVTLTDAAGNASSLTLATFVIDTTAPTVISFTTATETGSYNKDEQIVITANTSEAIKSGNTITVTLDTNDTVELTAASAGTTLVGTYTVGTGDTSAGLTVTSFTIGEVTDAGGNVMTSTALPGASSIFADKTIVIDTTAPTITSVTSTTDDGSYNEGDDVNVTVTFSEAVTLAGGNLVVTLETGTNDRTVTISTISGSNTASGTYEVQAGDTSSDLTASGIALSAGSLSDAAGNAMSSFAIGSNLASSSALVIDTTAPTITSVTSTTDDGSYNEGDDVNVTVTFSEAVTLAGGNLVVTLETGTNDRTVTISTISGSNTASGTYEVQAGDTSSDLTASGIALSAGSLSDAAGNAMSSFAIGSNLASSSALVIDTTAPTITFVSSSKSDGSYNSGELIPILIATSEAITVDTSSGTPSILLETGAEDDAVTYSSGSGSNVLIFNYTVGTGDTSSDLDYASTGALVLNSGTMTDAAGNALVLTLPTVGALNSLGSNKNLVIDTTAPTITSVTSTTDDGSYNEGDDVNVTVTFSEAVTLAGGNLVVTLETGTNDRTVTISTISGSNTASGTYEVQAGDTSSDLTASGIALSAGSLSDAAGNAMSSFAIGSNLASSSALVIDTTAPTITSVTSTTDDGSYNEGDDVNVTVTFSEAVTLAGGNLVVTLETGTNDRTVTISTISGSNTASGTYEVQAGDTSSDLTASGIALSAGSLSDAAGNAMSSFAIGSNLASSSALVIDTTAPTIEVVTEVTTPSNDTTPSYVFTTNEAGTITTNITQGFSTNASAGTGENTVTFNTLPAGTYADKTVTLTDAAGNASSLTLATFVIDTTAPTITSVTSTTDDGSYNEGDDVNVTVTFSEAVTLAGGNLVVTLETGTNDRTVTISTISGSNTASGTYEVQAGDTSSDLTASGIALSAGSLSDAAGNAMSSFAIGSNLASSSALVIDTTAPTITSVTSTTDDGSYNEGDDVNVTVTFSEAVTLAGGNLVVTLETGTNDRTVTISTISGSNTASGTYEVQAGDTSSDLTASGIALSAGSLSDAAGNAMSSFAIGSNLASSSALVIDTTAPTITSVTSTTDDGSYNEGDDVNVTVTFSEAVTLAGGNLVVTLETGTNDRTVTISTISGSNTASGTYEVQAGDTSSDLTASGIALSAGSLSDAAGNAMSSFAIGSNLASSSALVIDTTAPTITSVTSTTDDGLYNEGDDVNVTVTFSEAVTLAGGNLVVTLETGTNDRTVTISTISGSNTASGTYEVQAGDTSSDLTASGIALSAGSLSDAAGNAMSSFAIGSNLASSSALVIDTTPATVTNVTSTTDNGSYKATDAISIQVTFSEVVQVSGTPTLTLENGSSDAAASYSSGTGSNELTFTYTVGNGDTSTDLDYVATNSLSVGGSSGTVHGTANENGSITLTAPAGSTFTSVDFASYGNPGGSAGSFSLGSCHATNSQTKVESYLIGNSGSITIPASNSVFGDPCGGVTKRLYVSASYSPSNTITDIAGNATTLTLPAPGATGSLGANKALVIDTTAPTITSVSSSTSNGTYDSGDVTINVVFSEVVNVTGVPQLTLETGGSDAVVNYASGTGSNTLVFTYTISSGHNSCDLDYASASALALNSGTIKDAAENSATLTLAAPGESGSLGANNAIVIDTSDPTVAVNNITVNVGSGSVTITPAMIENGSSDNCDSDLTYEITTTNTFDCSDVGTVQTGAFRATDNAGNFTEASFEVTIVDTVAPVISLLGESTVTVEWLSSYTDAGATATDTCGGNLTSSIATVNPVNVNTVGSYTVTYNVSDASSNAATEVTRTVNVVDTVAPTLSNVSIASDSSVDTTYATATTDDNVTLTFTASEPIGTPTVTFQSGGDDINDSSVTYTNTSGNTWTAAYTVDSSDTDGAVSYSIAFTDSHSNAGTAVTSGSGSVTIDSTGPTMTINSNRSY